MRKFLITVYTEEGRYQGTGIALSSFALLDMAFDQFGMNALSISVRAV
jgi:hypothetical protein